MNKTTHAYLRNYAFSKKMKIWEVADKIINGAIDKE
jgi:AmiR/NasT family two-component response regulator